MKRAAPAALAGALVALALAGCGSSSLSDRDLRADDERRRILLYCPAGEGPDPCPFSETGAPGELAEEVFAGGTDYTRGRIFDERIAIAAYDYHGSACRFGHEQAGGGGKFIGDS